MVHFLCQGITIDAKIMFLQNFLFPIPCKSHVIEYLFIILPVFLNKSLTFPVYGVNISSSIEAERKKSMNF